MHAYSSHPTTQPSVFHMNRYSGQITQRQQEPYYYRPAGQASGYQIAPVTPVEMLISSVGAGLGAYHGYKRNDSVGWAIWWAAMGGLFPLVTLAVAVAQGFGKRASR